MSFLLYDLIFLGIFCLFIVSFLYKRRKNLKREGIIYLYRTKVGIRFIDYVGKKFKRVLGVLQYFSIALGYVLMIAVFYMLIKVTYTYLAFPEITRIIKAPPLVPLIPYFPEIFGVQSFFPPFYFTYFIIAVLVVATVHEFSHGIFAKAKGLKIKSTGFAFLGPIIGAFVEPDEKKMEKQPKLAQMGILSAGVFANVITTILFIFIAWLFLFLAFTEGGFIFNGYILTAVNVSSISSIGNYSIELNNANAEGILSLIKSGEIKESLGIPLDGKAINMTEIKANNKTYFISLEDLKAQLVVNKEVLVAFPDLPAVRSGLKGTIIELNGEKIKNQETLSRELAKYKPGDEVTIKTKFKEVILSYNLRLAESPLDKNKAFLGVSSTNYDNSG